MKKLILFFACFACFAGNSFSALSITNLAPTNITTTSAWLCVHIKGTNAVADVPTNVIYYGTVDYTNNAALWANSNVYGAAGSGIWSKAVTGLSPSHKYYFRWQSSDSSTSVWSLSTSNFWTKPSAPTTTPAVVTISVQSDTNGDLKSPTNFFGANTDLMATAMSGLYAAAADFNSVSAEVANVQLNVTTVSNLVDAHSSQIGAISGEVDNIQLNVTTVSNTAGGTVTALTGVSNRLDNAVLNIAAVSNTTDIIQTSKTYQVNFVAVSSRLDNVVLNVASISGEVDNIQLNTTAVSNKVDLHTDQIAFISNTVGEGASGWSTNPAVSTVDMNTNGITNVAYLFMDKYLQVEDTNDTANVMWPTETSLAPVGNQQRTAITMRNANANNVNFLVLSPHDTTNLFSDGIRSYTNVMVLAKYQNGLMRVGINKLPGSSGGSTPALDVMGEIRSDTMTATNSITATSGVFTNLQVTAGGPTNGAVLIATNNNGTGKWSAPVGFEATASGVLFTNQVERSINWTETKDIGGCFDGVTFVAPVNGVYCISVFWQWQIDNGTTTTFADFKLYKSALAIMHSYSYKWAGGYGMGCLSGQIYLTNNSPVYVSVSGSHDANTNKLSADSTASGFSAFLIRELP